MGSYKIRRLNLPQNIVEILEKKNLHSCKDVLQFTKLELQLMLGLSRNKIENILQEISKKCISTPQTAYDIFKDRGLLTANGFLPLCLHSLDLLLQGGLPFGSITELTGPPGVGKTQFCFMLSVLASLPPPHGLGTGVIYIDTESTFCAQRLQNMVQKKFSQKFKQENIIQSLQRVLIHKIISITVLKEVICQLEKEIIRNNVKLIIIDSIASLMRKEFGIDSILERNKILMEQTAVIKDLAQTYNVVVFMTNQIASHLIDPNSVHPEDEDEDVNNHTDFGSGRPPAPVPKKKPKIEGMDADHMIPALGNTWSHCVNTRLVAQFLDPSVRQLTIVKSPVAPNAAVRYTINESGIVLTDDDIEFVNVSSRHYQNILTKNNFLTPEVTGTGVVFTATTM
ncbi:DNA repair protein RAD51 homolog 2 [Caerostris darwini]|uniref:DNA repair protein RAD51 homolog 2 n=1 Tax=Caerostris darwini TaxID=1538125 RepID=A0AAV4QGA0_9ARAC|nr:DNA repair protein RAD51 homolog 2 [Caerostris darwini]